METLFSNETEKREVKWWTDKECEDFRNTILKYPSCYQEAFRQHARKWDRSEISVTAAFYGQRNKLKKFMESNPISMLRSDNILVKTNKKLGYGQNNKNLPSPASVQEVISSPGIQSTSVNDGKTEVVIQVLNGELKLDNLVISGERLEIKKYV